MKRAVVIVLGLLAIAAGLVLLWLGPGAIAWSAKAATSPAEAAAAWSHVPAGVPGVATCDLGRALESRVGLGVRPELEALAALRGADLSWFEERIDEVIVVHDGAATGYALGRRLEMSPLLLARFDERWGPIEGGGLRGASDGMLALFPLEPGLVLASEASAAGMALQLAQHDGESEEALLLDEPGQTLRARLTMTPALRAHARRAADARLIPIVESLDHAELELTALDELEGLLTLSCRDEASAATTEGLLRQVEFAANASRQAGGLAVALLGDAGRLLRDLPALDIVRSGSTVRVRAVADADELRPWLRRALDAMVEDA